MLENEMQEWEEYDSRIGGEVLAEPVERWRHEQVGHQEQFDQEQLDEAGPFLLDGAAEVPACHCAGEHSCAGSGGCAQGSARAHGEFELEFGQESELTQAGTCDVDCSSPPPAELKLIRAAGKPEGDFIVRTEGDPSVNLAIQLFDYDVNAYTPTKAKHQEALTRVREFIVNRSTQTTEPIAVTITGLASRTGAVSYNDVLSCKRARCVAANLQTSLGFFRGVAERVVMNAAGEGFTHATCKGRDCEQGDWRAVLIQVHAPGAPPRPLPPIDPGWDKYTMRCCSFHTEPLASALLGELLKKGLPGIPESIRKRIPGLLQKGLGRLLKGVPKLGGVLAGATELLDLFPAEFIRERGVFDIRERDKATARGVILCYSGYGLRIVFPRKNIDEFLDETIAKVPAFKALPAFVREQIKNAVKKLIPDGVKTLVQPIESDTPGPLVRFDLKHARHLKVFEGVVNVGKGVWMPGQVNVEFESPPWHIPDPIKRPLIQNCQDADCNVAGVQMVVGDRRGLELFSITAGELVPGACECAAPVSPPRTVARSLMRSPRSLTREAYGESEGETEGEGEFTRRDPYASVRPVWAPTRQRVLVNGAEIPLAEYLRMIARLCSDVAATSNALGRA
jgi:outer membrane protein OmpA-like peptidoglycan-associated protein